MAFLHRSNPPSHTSLSWTAFIPVPFLGTRATALNRASSWKWPGLPVAEGFIARILSCSGRHFGILLFTRGRLNSVFLLRTVNFFSFVALQVVVALERVVFHIARPVSAQYSMYTTLSV